MTNFTDPAFVQRLTTVLLNAPWSSLGLRARAWLMCPDDRRLVAEVVRRVWEQFGKGRPSRKTLAGFLHPERGIKLQATFDRIVWATAMKELIVPAPLA